MKVLGTYLRDKRKSLNLSIQDVADKLNLAYSTVANMETGTKNPTLEQLKAYGLIFGCEWTEITSNVIDIKKTYSDSINEELQKVIKETGCQGIDYELTIADVKADRAELQELVSYFNEIEKEYEEKRSKEDLKIKNDIDAAINTIMTRWITKDTPAIDPKEIPNLRDEVMSLIVMRVQHLTTK